MVTRERIEFKVGNVVVLRSGSGPRMTVNAVTPAGIGAIWWRGATLQGGTFHPSTLALAAGVSVSLDEKAHQT